LIAIAGVASFRGVESLKKRAGEYKDEIIAQDIAMPRLWRASLKKR
jgi:hypothetical protein